MAACSMSAIMAGVAKTGTSPLRMVLANAPSSTVMVASPLNPARSCVVKMTLSCFGYPPAAVLHPL
jgi:hypothetical protein